jgi:hypothetical protein
VWAGLLVVLLKKAVKICLRRYRRLAMGRVGLEDDDRGHRARYRHRRRSGCGGNLKLLWLRAKWAMVVVATGSVLWDMLWQVAYTPELRVAMLLLHKVDVVLSGRLGQERGQRRELWA